MIKLVDLLKEAEDFDLSDNPLVGCRYKVLYFDCFENSIDNIEASYNLKDFNTFCQKAMKSLQSGADTDNQDYERDPKGYDFDPPNSHVDYFESEGIMTGVFVSDWDSLPMSFLVIDKRAGDMFEEICTMYEEGNKELSDYVNDFIND